MSLVGGFIATGVTLGGYLASRISTGSCAKPDLQPNFDLDSYLGTWYEMERSSHIKFETGECITANYSLLDSGYVEVLNSQLFDDGTIDWLKGTARCSNWQLGHCGVRFSAFQPWGNYDVLSTDYTSYVIVYSCTGILADAFKLDFVWILTRDPLVPGSQEYTDMQTKAYDIMAEKIPNFDTATLRTTQQGGDCVYNPMNRD